MKSVASCTRVVLLILWNIASPFPTFPTILPYIEFTFIVNHLFIHLFIYVSLPIYFIVYLYFTNMIICRTNLELRIPFIVTLGN